MTNKFHNFHIYYNYFCLNYFCCETTIILKWQPVFCSYANAEMADAFATNRPCGGQHTTTYPHTAYPHKLYTKQPHLR